MEPLHYPEANRNPGALAIVTLILALVGIVTGGITSIAALVTGYIEAGNIRAGRSPAAGESYNRAGIIIAWIAIALWFVAIVLFFLFGAALLGGLWFMGR